MGDWWWDTQNQPLAGSTIVAVICASDNTHLTNFPGNQQAWLLDLTIINIRKDIHLTTTLCSWIILGLIPGLPKGAKYFAEASHDAVGTVLSQLRHRDITGPGLKWDCDDGIQRQCYPLLAAWVGDYPDQVMVAQVSYGPCPMCEIPKGVPMGLSTFRPLEYERDQHIYSQLLEDNDIDALHTLCVPPICTQFWQYLLCNVYRLSQPDELHQLLLGLVKGLLNWLLEMRLNITAKCTATSTEWHHM